MFSSSFPPQFVKNETLRNVSYRKTECHRLPRPSPASAKPSSIPWPPEFDLPPDQIQQRDSWSFPTATTDYKTFPRITTSSSQQSLTFSSSSPSSSLHVALRSVRVRDKTPTKITLCFTSQSAKGAFKRLVGNLTKKLQTLFNKTCRSLTPVLPSLSLCLPASERERSVIPSLLLRSTRTCNCRRPARVLCREGDLFGVALLSASPLSCGGRSRPALPQRSVPVPTAKEPDPETGDGFSKVEPELESFFPSKWENK